MRISTSRSVVRRVGAGTAAAALVLTLAACGGSDDNSSSETSGSGDAATSEGTDTDAGTEASGDVSGKIRFSWWGSDTRQKITQDAIDAFEAKYPDVEVEPDYTSWDNYFEKLNVAAAGGDLPCVITQEERFLTEYAKRGLLADLKELGVETSDMDAAVVESGEIDGSLVGVPTGVSVYAVLANKTVFEEAGVDLPDDTTWTWDDYEKLAEEIHTKSDGKYWGVQDYSMKEMPLKIIARQQGQEMFTPEGTIGVDQDVVQSFFQRSLDLQAAKGEPGASESVEIQSAGVEGSLVATNKGGMAWFWSNELNAVSNASGEEIVILRAPGETDGTRTGMYYKPTMYYSIAKECASPDAATALVNFLVNSEEAGKIIETDRGLPANLTVREMVVGQLEGPDKVSAEFVASLSDVIVDGTPVPPTGSGETSAITQRINEEMLAGRIDSATAAERWISELTKAIS